MENRIPGDDQRAKEEALSEHHREFYFKGSNRRDWKANGLVFKECHCYGTWAGVGADGATDGCQCEGVCSIFPDFRTVFYIFLGQGIREAAVSQSVRFAEVDAAAVLN